MHTQKSPFSRILSVFLWRLQLFLNPTPLIVHMAEAHLQTPPVLMWEQIEKKKYKKKHTKITAPTDIHVVCKQPKLQYGIERVLSFNS